MRRIAIITTSRLNASAIAEAVGSPRHGAVATFAGVVRASHAGRTVKGMTYDCHGPLARKELERILDQAETKWRVSASAAHRIGRLKVGEVSVFVAAGSVHRPEAFAACRWIIDEIKLRLPVWKKEHYVRGDGRWLPGCALHRRKR